MSSEIPIRTSSSGSGIGRRVADSIAERNELPTALRAVLGYYAESGSLSLSSLKIQSATDRFISETIEELFLPVGDAISTRIDAAPDDVSFEYDTKLTLPAELTLGQVYYRARQSTATEFDPVRKKVRTPILEYFRFPFDKEHETERRNEFLQKYSDIIDTIDRAERMTELVTAALIDGDMRDALNDSEYEDFQVNFPIESSETRQAIAECAQETLQAIVEERFEQFDSGVKEAYKEAVAISESHQERDQYFRDLAERARSGDTEARERIETEFKYADFESPPDVFDQRDLELPYLLSQYRRVGVIYKGMIEMYREAEIGIDEAFEKSIVFSIIGAQIWLDDVDDFDADFEGNQLTPVTAEYLLHRDNSDAFRAVNEISQQYLDAAKHHASLSNSPLAGIGSDYIYRSGDPTVLPQ